MFAEVTYLVLIRRHSYTVNSDCCLGEIYKKASVTCGWPFASDFCPVLIVNPLEKCKRFCCGVTSTKQNRITPTASVFDFVLYVVREVASRNLTLMPHGKCFGFDPRPLKTPLILCLNVYLFSSTYQCIAFFQPRGCSLLFLGLTLHFSTWAAKQGKILS